MEKVPVKLRLEQGVCITCGLEPLVTKHLGEMCRKRANAKCTLKYRTRMGIPLDAKKYMRTRTPPKAEVTRQRMQQRDHVARGLCVKCSQPSVNGTHQCEKHLLKTRAYSLKSSRVKAGIPLDTPKGVHLPARLKNPTK